MSLFERLLTLWVALCIMAGLVLGNLAPGLFGTLAALEYASVNLVVAVLIWAMVYPMMIAVDFGSLKAVGKRPKGLVITLAVNWLIKPFTMAALAVLFFEHVFAGLIDPDRAPEYIAGLILLGAAPCTAMVFVWSQLTRGDPNYTLVQVSVNDLIMVVAFAPIVAFLLGVTDITVPWETLILSVVLYIVIPLIAGMLTRRALIAKGGERGGDGVHGADQASFRRGPAADGDAALRVPGAGDPCTTAADRADCAADRHPVLRHLRARVWMGLGLGRAAQGRRALRADRHIELLRTGGRGGDRAFRAELRRGAGHGGRRAGRGARDAEPRRHRQPDTREVPRMSTFPIVIHHPADRGTSRNVLGIIRAAGQEVTVAEY